MRLALTIKAVSLPLLLSLWAFACGHWNFVTYKESFIRFKHRVASKCYYKRNRVTAVNFKALFDFSIALYLILLLKISCPCFLIIVKDKCLPSWGCIFYFLSCQFSFFLAWSSENLNQRTENNIFKSFFPIDLNPFFPAVKENCGLSIGT